MRRIFYLFTILPFFTNGQTCIIVLSINDTVIIGADSKAGVRQFSTIPNVKVTPFYTRQDCKIRQEKNVFYMASGRWAADFLEYGKESIVKQTKFIDTIFYLKNNAIKDLEIKLENSRLYDHANFIEDFKRKSIGRIAFVWFNKGKPKFHGFIFNITSDSTERVRIEIKDSILKFDAPNTLNVQILGTGTAIKDRYGNPSYWKSNKTLENGMLKLLKKQAEATPETVGEPYSIVRIVKDGKPKWYMKGKCD